MRMGWAEISGPVLSSNSDDNDDDDGECIVGWSKAVADQNKSEWTNVSGQEDSGPWTTGIADYWWHWHGRRMFVVDFIAWIKSHVLLLQTFYYAFAVIVYVLACVISDSLLSRYLTNCLLVGVSADSQLMCSSGLRCWDHELNVKVMARWNHM